MDDNSKSMFEKLKGIRKIPKVYSVHILSTRQKLNRVEEGFNIEMQVKDDMVKEIKPKTKNTLIGQQFQIQKFDGFEGCDQNLMFY